MAYFVARLHKQLDTAVESQQFRNWTAPKTWFASRCDSLAAIRALAADDPLDCTEASQPEEPHFFDELQASIREPQRRFELLATRYLHPRSEERRVGKECRSVWA